MSREELFKKEVKRSVDKIKVKYKPEKIFAFGSFANGRITADRGSIITQSLNNILWVILIYLGVSFHL